MEENCNDRNSWSTGSKRRECPAEIAGWQCAVCVRQSVASPSDNGPTRGGAQRPASPFAIIVGCSDSRVPPEIIFDQGLGDLFVVRLPGHFLIDEVLGSIEYAVEHLGTRLIVVLGHERCGAVEAVVKGAEASGHIGSLVKAIKPAVDRAKSQPGDLLENAIWENVAMTVDQLQSSSLLQNPAKNGALKIVGAYYHLEDGSVTIFT